MKPGTYYACTPGATSGDHTDFHTYQVTVYEDQSAMSSGIRWSPTWTDQMESSDRLHATPEDAEREARRVHGARYDAWLADNTATIDHPAGDIHEGNPNGYQSC